MNGFLAEIYPRKIDEVATAAALVPQEKLEDAIMQLPPAVSFRIALGASAPAGLAAVAAVNCQNTPGVPQIGSAGGATDESNRAPNCASFQDFEGSYAVDSLHLIAEVKPASPSLGKIQSVCLPEEMAMLYEPYASAISVLTDSHYFGGSFELLKRVAARTSRPALCKDFVIDPYQVYQARAAGAAAVLLIVRMLNDESLFELYRLIDRLTMTAVVEVQNEVDLDRAVRLQADTILINNRDLETLQTSLETTKRLAPLVPSSALLISASGISTVEDLRSLSLVARRFLIGSALMQSQAPGRLLAHFKNSAHAVTQAAGERTVENALQEARV